MFPTGSLESLSRPVPTPPLIAEAYAPLFGDRNRVLELDEAAPRMRHRGLDGEDHVGPPEAGSRHSPHKPKAHSRSSAALHD
jgi:hypothetical protein